MSNSELFGGDTWYSANNPLLTHIPEYKELSEIVEAIAFNPLAQLKIDELSFIDRDTLLTGEKVPFEPTMQSAKTVMTCYGMLKASLRARNPTLAQNQSYYWEVLRCANQGGTNIPPAPTPGLSIYVIKGITGTGKSVTLARLCSLLPQVIQHGKVEKAGWSSLRQLVYLNVFVSHDGSRKGFLHAILLEIDKALGTNYAIDLPKSNRTVETLAIAVIGRLTAHYCGIMFVDEAQLRNLVDSGQAELMQMFLLLIMNSGIPLVISGNEKAFDWVTYSQDLSRLNQIPSSHFAPIGAIKNSNAEAEWDAIYAGISSYYVLKNRVIDPVSCSETLWRCSGGIARLALTLWCSAQRQALFNGEETIDFNAIQTAYESPEYSYLRSLADGFHFKKPELLSIYPDVDVDFYAKHWGMSPIQSEVQSNNFSRTDLPPCTKYNKATSGKTKLKKEQTRNKNKENKRAQLNQFMRPEDIRKQGLINHHLAGLAAMKTEAEKEPIR